MTEEKRLNTRLRRERELKGWSQRTIAEQIGTNPQTVTRWELGEHKPSRYFQTKLCELFGKSAEELGFMDSALLSRGEEEIRTDTANQASIESNKILNPSIRTLESPIEERDLDMDRSRRSAIAGLLGLLVEKNKIVFDPEPWDRLSHSMAKPATMSAETFHYFQQILECGWGLSNAGELEVAEHLLMSFLPKMTQLAPYQQQATSLTAEGMRLRGILAAHQQRLLDKLTICLQAVEYARQTLDPNILVAQLAELAVAFKYARQPANSFKTYQEALSYCRQEQISPMIRSRVYAASAATFAKNGYIKEARSHLEQAYEIFPSRLDNEPRIFAADNDLFMIGYYEGLLHLVLNRPVEADQAFEQVLTRFPKKQIPERWRLIILNYQGLATILSGQQEKYAVCLEDGISSSIALRSKKRFDEALSIFQRYMPKAWLLEPPIRQIVEHFQLEWESEREEELEI